MKIKRILVGVDDSKDALLALDYAIQEAKEHQAELVITSILESHELNVYQAMSVDHVHGERKNLEKHVLLYRQKAIDAGVVNVNIVISEGKPGETIVKKVIPEVKPDMLIIGSLAKTGITKYFGSQAAYMAKYSPISVTVIR